MSEIKEIIMNVILNNWVEIIGYLASLLIVASFLTSSLIKLRWINLIGVIVFITYGFIINSKPVLLTNLIIAIVNIYYLLKIYSSKEYFQLLEINTGDTYLKNYLEFYKEDIKKYFPYFEHQQIVEQPLKKVNMFGQNYISVRLTGGGIKSQAEAVRHGIARALLNFNEDWKKTLRGEGYLTRDSRKKERKKPGLKGARRAPQWQKR